MQISPTSGLENVRNDRDSDMSLERKSSNRFSGSTIHDIDTQKRISPPQGMGENCHKADFRMNEYNHSSRSGRLGSVTHPIDRVSDNSGHAFFFSTFSKSLSLQSFTTLTLSTLYHLYHIVLILLMLSSPILLRSLTFSSTSMEAPLAELEKARGTSRIASIWSVHNVSDFFENDPRSGKTVVPPAGLLRNASVERKGRRIALPETLSGIIATWVASPLYSSPAALSLFYYLYLVSCIVLVTSGTRGHLTGHFSLVRLIFCALELLWYMHHGLHSFFVLLWLIFLTHVGKNKSDSSLSPLLEHGTPYISLNEKKGPSVHLFYKKQTERGGTSSRYYQQELDPNKYIYPLANELNFFSFLVGSLFLMLLIGCMIKDLLRVFYALFGLKPLSEHESRHRCPLCGEEWYHHPETGVMHVSIPEEPIKINSARSVRVAVGEHPITEKSNLLCRAPGDPDNTLERPFMIHDEDFVADTTEEDENEGGVVRVIPHTSLHVDSSYFAHSIRHVHHRCPRLFLDRKAAEETESMSYEEGGFLGEVEEGQSVSYASGNRQRGSKDDKELAKARARNRIDQEQMNMSFCTPVKNYGTLNSIHVVNRGLYDPCKDGDDEFRPGNAFPSSDKAKLFSLAIYTWMSPLMRFALLERTLLRQDRFLPSLPEQLTSLDHLWRPFWSLWIHRKIWYSHLMATNPLQENQLNGQNADDDANEESESESSDHRTLVILSRRSVVLPRKFFPQRPKLSLFERCFFCVTFPLRVIITQAFIKVFLGGAMAYIRRTWRSLDRANSSGHGESATNAKNFTNNDASGPEDSKARGNLRNTFNFFSYIHPIHDVSLFYLFKDHRYGRIYFFACPFLLFLASCFSLMTPLLIERFILAMLGEKEMVDEALMTCVYMFFVFLAQIVLRQLYLSLLHESTVAASSAVRTLLLEKSMLLPLAQRTCSESEISHLASSDVDTCAEAMHSFHQIWSDPFLTFCSVLWLLHYMGTFPVLMLTLVLILAILLQFQAETKTRVMEVYLLPLKREKFQSLVEAYLTAVRQIKAMCAEHFFSKLLLQARSAETNAIEAIETKRRSAEWRRLLFTVLIFFACFGTYSLRGGILEVQILIPALASLELIRKPLCELPVRFFSVLKGYISLKRIESFLGQEPDTFLGTWVDLTTYRSNNNVVPAIGTVICHCSSFTWQANNTMESPRSVLKDVEMVVNPSEHVLVEGPAGSGKSTLLLAILGEVNRVVSRFECSTFAAESASVVSTTSSQPQIQTGQGAAKTSSDGFLVFGRAAYCATVPWLQNDTIKANILAGKLIDLKWYEAVTKACALHIDFQDLPKGDKTVVGDKGTSLTAEQKARVALARAVYSRADIYLLDDVLLHLDETTREHVLREVIHKLLKHKTIIMCSSIGRNLLNPSRVYTISEDGVIRPEDTSEVVQAISSTSEPVRPHNGVDTPTAVLMTGPAERDRVSSSEESVDMTESSTEETWKNDKNKEEVTLKGGRLLRPTRKRSKRSWMMWPPPSLRLLGSRWYWLILLFAIEHFCVILLVFSVGLVSRPIDSQPYLSGMLTRSSFLTLCLLGGTGAFLVAFVRSRMLWSQITHVTHGAFASAAEKLFRLPIIVFDTEIILLNKLLLKDTKALDRDLPSALAAFLHASINVALVSILLIFLNPWLVVTAPIVFSIFRSVSEHYLTATREIRRLEVRSAESMKTILSEVLQGATVIRSLELQDTKREEYCHAVDVFNTAKWVHISAERWMELRLELLGVLTALASMIFSYLSIDDTHNAMGLAGVSIILCLGISERFKTICVSLKHIPSYLEIIDDFFVMAELREEEDGSHISPTAPNSQEEQAKSTAEVSTQQPLLELIDVSASYTRAMSYAIHRLNMCVYGKERLGIVGRVGCGKSTVFNLLLRLMDVIEGDILIDRVDIRKISYSQLRRSFFLIPQNPLIIEDTWRANLLLGLSLDAAPGERSGSFALHKQSDQEAIVRNSAGTLQDHYSEDQALWQVLRTVKLDDLVECDGGLDSFVGTTRQGGTSNLSAGTRLRICLARALLFRPRVLLMNEFSTPIDEETNAIMERVILNDLSDCTLLLVAHRAETVLKLCTRILLIEADGCPRRSMINTTEQGGDFLFGDLGKEQPFSADPFSRKSGTSLLSLKDPTQIQMNPITTVRSLSLSQMKEIQHIIE